MRNLESQNKLRAALLTGDGIDAVFDKIKTTRVDSVASEMSIS